MNFLLESPLAVFALGAVAVTMAAVVLATTRSRLGLVAIAVATVFTIGGVAFERWWQTPSEQVRAALQSLMAAVEADDLPRVLAELSPAATEMRGDAEALMPQFEVEKARVTGTPAVAFPAGADGTTATVSATVILTARHRKTGMKGGDFPRVTFEFEHTADRWRVVGYSLLEEWRSKATSLFGGR